MNHSRNSKRALVGAVAALSVAAASAQITFYAGPEFRGPAVETNGWVNDLSRLDFNDRASSVIVRSGHWEVCEDVRFEGRCAILGPGNYNSLYAMGLNDRISSVRPARAGAERPVPPPAEVNVYEFRRRPQERLIEVPIASVRAVVGPPQERCWMEREEMQGDRGQPNVGGAVAGGVIGSNVGRNNQPPSEREVRRCHTTQSTTPAYWDVTYNFRGQQHHVQMQEEPGSTILVNRQGELRL